MMLFIALAVLIAPASSTADVITAISPTAVVEGYVGNLVLTGTADLLAGSTVCLGASAAPCAGSACASTDDVFTVAVNTDKTIPVDFTTTPLTTASPYKLCHDPAAANAGFTEQTTDGLTFEVVAKAKAVSGLSSMSIYQGVTSAITITTAAAAGDKICFQQSSCPAAGATCATTALEVTVAAGAVQVAPPVDMALGEFKVCYMQAGGDYTLQDTTDLKLTVKDPALAITQIDPKTAVDGTEVEITVTGDVADSDQVCFREKCSECTTDDKKSVASLKVTVKDFASVGALKVCYQASGGLMTEQTTDGLTLTTTSAVLANSAITAAMLPTMPLALLAMSFWS